MSRPTSSSRQAHARRVDRALLAAYPEAPCALDHHDPFTLLVATILSAQCTDARVNQVTPALFARFPTAVRLATAPLAEVEQLVHSTGFFRAKARALVGTAQALVQHHGGEVPAQMAALVGLPGVARKTANVVLGLAFGRPEGVVVDTHVLRLARRLGLSPHTQPGRVEADLMGLWPKNGWIQLSLRLIAHGRAVCTARAPACGRCPLAEACPSRAAPS